MALNRNLDAYKVILFFCSKWDGGKLQSTKAG